MIFANFMQNKKLILPGLTTFGRIINKNVREEPYTVHYHPLYIVKVTICHLNLEILRNLLKRELMIQTITY